MELRELRYFKVLAATLNFAVAAKHLHITQPPLSRAIQNLESELNIQLFFRSTRKVKLTPAGESFLRYVNRMNAVLNEGITVSRAIHEGKAGTLRIGYIGSAMQNILPNYLEIISEKLPEITLNLVEYTTTELIALILDEDLDIALVRGPIYHPECDYFSLYRETFSFAVPASVDLKNVTEISKLANLDCVLFPREMGSELYDKVIWLCQELGLVPKIRHHSNHMRSILKMVELGMGYSIVPTSTRNDLMLNIRFIKIPKRFGTTEIGVLTRKTKGDLTNKFITFIRS